jgi:DNA end-binding protein Ku
MRAIWKGHLRFSLVTIPIRVYNAVDTTTTIRFNQLHRDCNGPVGYDKRCKKCHSTLSAQEIVKGYQYEPDRFVLVESTDFENIKLKSTKIIEIEGFVNKESVHPTLFDAPYFAGPDGDVAGKAYSLFAQALNQTGKIGIGKVVLRDREDVVLIAPMETGLVLYKLRYPEEIRKIDQVPQLNKEKVDTEQLKLAVSLIDSMTSIFTDIKFEDRYHQSLREMIESKISGKEVVAVEEEDRPVVDIMTALKQSIDEAKKQRKPMQKAGKKSTPKVQRKSA